MADRAPTERTLGCARVGGVRVAVDCTDLVCVDDPDAVDRSAGDIWLELSDLFGTPAPAASNEARVLVTERDGVRLLLAVPARVTVRTVEASAVKPVPTFVDGLRNIGVVELLVEPGAISYVLNTPDLARLTRQEGPDR